MSGILYFAMICYIITGTWSQSMYWDPSEVDSDETLEEIASSLVSKLSGSCDSSHLLTRLILQETSERAKLQVALEQQLTERANVTKRQKVLEERLAKLEKDALSLKQEERVVAFSVRLRKNLENLTSAQAIIFGTVVTNIGGAYNPRTGIFRCPVSGLYQFFVSILGQRTERVETELVVNGKKKLLVYSSGDAIHRGSLGSNTVLLQLEQWDVVWVRLHYDYGGYIHCCWSTFSGYLIKQNVDEGTYY
ncbi:complement C1q tumor necrosis factor-related protein 4-like [Liolophura sinensis]|uniref:complement C1q tumor necrosis factor-related protein 4-like n=1 Tax=Liolophura sinensis TaxID=3198878 RepID=UPI003158E662